MLGHYRRYLAILVIILLIIGSIGSMALSSSADDSRGAVYAGSGHAYWRQPGPAIRDYVGDHSAEYLALLDEGKQIRVPTIKDLIPSGKAQMSGFSSLPEAKKTVDILSTVELPVMHGVIMTRD